MIYNNLVENIRGLYIRNSIDYAKCLPYISKLRDCFNAGYLMPQFCADNSIKKPLFIALNIDWFDFIRDLHVQFIYDKSLSIKPEFALIDGDTIVKHIYVGFIQPVICKNISKVNIDSFDRIIVLAYNKTYDTKIIYLNELCNYFFNRTYCEIPLLNYLYNHPKVKMININFPTINTKSEFNTELEKQLIAEASIKPVRPWATLSKRIEENKNGCIKTSYDILGYTNQQVLKLIKAPKVTTNTDGSTSLEDSNDDLLNIKNGKRSTAYQPEKYDNKIWFLGMCVHYGIGVPWNKTMESYLQKLLNDNNIPFLVENESQIFGSRYQDIFYNLNKIPARPNDIIIISVPFNEVFRSSIKVERFLLGRENTTKMQNKLKQSSIPCLDLSRICDRPHNYGEVFADIYHINENGHKAVADYLFEFFTKNNFFKNIDFNYPLPPRYIYRYGVITDNFITNTNIKNNTQLEDYKKCIRKKRLPIGCIVMNCNPFTFGHQYLIEYAANKVLKLYVFVVEEDKSEFKFEDRFKLVQEGVRHIKNVEILPSGKFIISQQTFSEYFNKENLQDVVVDSSEDVEIFAKEIAPSLGINVRFVGQEPEDTVTNQYNQTMKRILPQYNIDVLEIPRFEKDGELISAKKVRAALKCGDFKKIERLVPRTTYDFLCCSYGKKLPTIGFEALWHFMWKLMGWR